VEGLEGFMSPRLPQTPAGPTEHKARYFMRLAAERERQMRAEAAYVGLTAYALKAGINGDGDGDRIKNHTDRIR
jgi:hypothetical protein